MDLHQFFTTSRVLVVAGKGGVGKTTVSAVLARAAADSGLRVLVVDLDGKPTLASLLATATSQPGPFPYGETEIEPGRLSGRTLDSSGALAEYLDEHGLKRVSKRLVSSGIIDVVSTAAPGIDDILVLGKLKQIERAADHVDLVIVDGPAAGHAITFLQAASGLLDAVRGGPISTQARDVLAMLSDPARCQVVLVTLPETTPVNELIETAYALEDRVGVHLAPIVVNGLDPGVAAGLPDPDSLRDALRTSGLPAATVRALRAAAEFRAERRAMQRHELARLSESLPLPQIHLPAVTAAGLDAHHIATMASGLTDSQPGETR